MFYYAMLKSINDGPKEMIGHKLYSKADIENIVSANGYKKVEMIVMSSPFPELVTWYEKVEDGNTIRVYFNYLDLQYQVNKIADDEHSKAVEIFAKYEELSRRKSVEDDFDSEDDENREITDRYNKYFYDSYTAVETREHLGLYY